MPSVAASSDKTNRIPPYSNRNRPSSSKKTVSEWRLLFVSALWVMTVSNKQQRVVSARIPSTHRTSHQSDHCTPAVRVTTVGAALRGRPSPASATQASASQPQSFYGYLRMERIDKGQSCLPENAGSLRVTQPTVPAPSTHTHVPAERKLLTRVDEALDTNCRC